MAHPEHQRPDDGKRDLRYYQHAPKTVAIVGMGPSIIDIFNELLTQEARPDFADEIWAINMASNVVWHDLVFWMDDLHDQENFRPGLLTLLRRRGKPVITTRAYPDILPHSYDYPLQEIAQMAFPVWGHPYLTNGVAYAIAYAIWKGVKSIRLYGCDFTYPNRNFAEEGRANAEAWITLASMRGINVMVAPSTSLIDACGGRGLYGYKEPPPIRLADGRVFEYKPVDQVYNRPAYLPEDSSGLKQGSSDELRDGIPGEGGPRPGDGGRDSVARLSADGSEAPATGGPGAGVQDRDQPGVDQGPASLDADPA